MDFKIYIFISVSNTYLITVYRCIPLRYISLHFQPRAKCSLRVASKCDVLAARR